METNTDYECYLAGCRSAGVKPLGLWRFRLLQQAYLRRIAQQEHGSRRRLDLSPLLKQLAALVAEGYKIAAGNRSGDDEPGTAACGVREPRVPLEPVLTGCAARSLPSPNVPDQSFWRT